MKAQRSQRRRTQAGGSIVILHSGGSPFSVPIAI
jgi:hypothetical protein